MNLAEPSTKQLSLVDMGATTQDSGTAAGTAATGMSGGDGWHGDPQSLERRGSRLLDDGELDLELRRDSRRRSLGGTGRRKAEKAVAMEVVAEHGGEAQDKLRSVDGG